jgi:hypothetical protein
MNLIENKGASLIKYMNMAMYVWVEIQIRAFLSLKPDGGVYLM